MYMYVFIMYMQWWDVNKVDDTTTSAAAPASATIHVKLPKGV
jgi:hypothetical protein